MKILLIDDEEAFAGAIRDLLSLQAACEHSVEWVGSYDEGLAAVTRETYDVCLLDQVLDQRDGLSLMHKAKESGCDTPFVMLTGHGGFDVDRQAMEQGASDYLEKSELTGPVLERALRHTVERAKFEQSLRQTQRQLEDRIAERTRELSEAVEALNAKVAEHRQTEQALRDSEERFRNLAEYLPGVSIQGYTTDGTVFYWNRASEEVYGYTAQEAVGKNLRELIIPPEWHSAFDQGLELGAKAIQSGELMPAGEYDLLHKDGRRVPVHSVHTVVCLHSGERLLFCIDVDLSERKKVEQALRESQQRFANMAANVQGMLYTFEMDPDGRQSISYASAGCRTVFGVEPEEAMTDAHTLMDMAAPEDRAGFIDSIESSRATLEPWQYEGRIKTKTGQEKWVWCLARPERLENGTVRWDGLAVDITARKRAESTTRRLAQAVEQTHEAIIIADTDGLIEYVNPAFEHSTGYARDEVVGRDLCFLKSGQHDGAYCRDLWQTLREDGVWHGRMINRRKDGSLLHEDTTISAVRDASGKTVAYVAVQRDVTQEVNLEHQLAQAQRMEFIGRLAGGIAHDFNNLLTPIIGYADVLLMELAKDKTLAGQVTAIREAAERAAAITKQLLAFGRKQVLEPARLNLNDVINELRNMLERLIGEDIEVTVALDPHIGVVMADRSQAEQVLMNLAINARDAMPDGGRLRIETGVVQIGEKDSKVFAAMQPGTYVTLAVSDTGHGMDEETRRHIFEPFFTTKRQGKGVGLGLATVYGIVKQHQGYIEAQSAPGKGSRFEILLPQFDESPQGALAEVQPGKAQPGSETVLVVEDEELVRKLVRDMLAAYGYGVLEAANPQEALQVAQQYRGPIHLLLTDVVLPRMNGKELYAQLSAKREGLRVLYMSGHSGDAISYRGVLDEGAHFLQKPFTAHTLTKKVREALADMAT